MTPVQQKILTNVQIIAEGCWLWQGYHNTSGYGKMFVSSPEKMHGKMKYVHRLSYQEFVGPIPDDLVLDHLCRTPPCVNPTHLETVTSRLNTYRGNNPKIARRLDTYCARGHEFTVENTIITAQGRRRCRTCTYASNRVSGAQWRERRRSA